MPKSTLLESRQLHHPKIAAMLEEADYAVSIENQVITRVEWGSQADDFAFLNWVVAELLQLEFAFDQPVYPQLESLLTKIDAVMLGQSEQRVGEYKKLNDPTVVVSRSHKGTTPYEHKKNVLAKLELQKFISQFEQASDKTQFLIQTIIEVLLHDWGKNVIANGDTSQYHAEISFLFIREWIKTWDENLQQQLNPARLLDVTRYHHAFQFVDQGQFTVQDIMRELPDLHTFMALSLVASADAASVTEYSAYSLYTLLESLRLALAQDQNIPEVRFFITQVFYNIEKLSVEAQEPLQRKKDGVLQKLTILSELEVASTTNGSNNDSNEWAPMLAALVTQIHQLLGPVTTD